MLHPLNTFNLSLTHSTGPKPSQLVPNWSTATLPNNKTGSRLAHICTFKEILCTFKEIQQALLLDRVLINAHMQIAEVMRITSGAPQLSVKEPKRKRSQILHDTPNYGLPSNFFSSYIEKGPGGIFCPESDNE